MAPQLQQSLFTNGADFVAGLHDRSQRNRIYTAQIYDDPDHGSWHQQGKSYSDAIKTAATWEELSLADCYVTANGFQWGKGTGRTVSATRSLNCFYVDFDRYNFDAYKNLSAADFLSLVLSENDWLPVPTMFVDSGNGCWMFWNFKRPLYVPSTYTWLEQWQTQQDFLIRKLSKYGADPACSDAARLVRCAGTVNSKTERKATAWKTSEQYEFGALKKVFNAVYKAEMGEKAKPLVPEQDKRKTKNNPTPHSRKVTCLFNYYTLAWNRMQDIRKLADLRGGKFTEHRRIATWVFAVSAAHYCRSEQTLRAEVQGFINNRIAEPGKYLETINYESTVERFHNELDLMQQGMTRTQAKKQLGYGKRQYELSNPYLIEQLEITPQEQRKLATIIDKTEVQRRNTEYQRNKRRKQGAMPRSDYENRAKQRQAEAVRLYAKLGSVRAVSRQMGLSVGVVHRYLGKAAKNA